jgi:hypothetical protein
VTCPTGASSSAIPSATSTSPCWPSRSDGFRFEGGGGLLAVPRLARPLRGHAFLRRDQRPVAEVAPPSAPSSKAGPWWSSFPRNSSGGDTVLPFRPSLLSPPQPTAGRSHPPGSGTARRGLVSEEVAYWRDMTLPPLPQPPRQTVDHRPDPLRHARRGIADRKELARRLHAAVCGLRRGMAPARLPSRKFEARPHEFPDPVGHPFTGESLRRLTRLLLAPPSGRAGKGRGSRARGLRVSLPSSANWSHFPLECDAFESTLTRGLRSSPSAGAGNDASPPPRRANGHPASVRGSASLGYRSVMLGKGSLSRGAHLCPRE